MGVSFEQLREVCQRPVASSNDVSGLLFGDRLSLPLTKLFIDRELSPNLATVGMLVCGIVGSALQLISPGAAVAGAVILVMYYLLDCVDGEVARWRKVEHARWGYYEYIFHFIVKPLVFASVGLTCWLETGSVWMLGAAFSASVATLWLKLFFAVPSLVFVNSVLPAGSSGDRPYGHYLDDAVQRAAELSQSENVKETVRAESGVFRLGFDLVTARSLSTNFDVGLALLVVLSALDWALPGADLFGLSGCSFRVLWLCYYGVILPLDFIDYVRSYVGQRRFDKTMVRLLAFAHGFALEGEKRAREVGPPPLAAANHEAQNGAATESLN
ncbi:MAG: hypothetical protein ACI9EF_001195 [Pseudohongiellaceae bacterium]|jgi:hypothetical protein